MVQIKLIWLVLLDENGHVHLTDFNVAVKLKSSANLTAVAGSLAYIGTLFEFMANPLFKCSPGNPLEIRIPDLSRLVESRDINVRIVAWKETF